MDNKIEQELSYSDSYDSQDSNTYSSSYYYEESDQCQTSHSYDFNGMQIIQTPNGGGACFCGKVFSTYNYCRVHFITVHGEDTTEKTLICLICQHPFAFDLNLKNHLKKQHAINSKLSYVEGSDDQLAVTESGQGVCLVCSKKFSTLNYCKVHYRTKHGQAESSVQVSYYPSQIGTEMSQEETLLPLPENLKHVQNKQMHSTGNHDNQSNQYQIDQCSEAPKNDILHDFSQQLNVPTSLTIQQNRLKRPYTESSDKVQPNQSNVDLSSQRNKQSRCEEEIPVSKTPSGGGYCQICGKTYSRIDTARSHFVQVHGEDEENKQFFCLICSKGFVFEINLNSHVKQSHGISGKLQLYEGCGGMLAKIENGGGVCLICGAKYSRMDTLKSHFKTKHESLQDFNHTAMNSNEKLIPSNSNGCISNISIASPEKGTSSLSELALAIKEEKRKEVQNKSITNNHCNFIINQEETNIQNTPMIRPVNINALTMNPTYSSDIVTNKNSVDASNTESNENKDKLRISATESGGGICLVCNTSFSLYGNCKAHFIKKHGEDIEGGEHICLICEKKFNFQINLKEHLKTAHGINGIPTRFEESGDGYYMAKLGNDGGVCLKCNQTFTLFGNLKAHYSKKHGNFQTNFDATSNLSASSTVHPETINNFTLSSPAKYLPLPKNLMKTNDIKHRAQHKSSNSSASPKKLSVKSEPKHNSKIIPNNEPELQIAKTDSGGGICLVCNVSFSQYGNCKVHFIKKHGEDGTGDLHCLMCQAQFKFSSSFKEHMSGNHGINGNLQLCSEYGDGSKMAKDEKGGGACLICCKYFSQFGNLKVHFTKKHSKE